MNKIFGKQVMIKIMGVINCLAICLTVCMANRICNWLYFQEEEPEEVKNMRKF